MEKKYKLVKKDSIVVDGKNLYRIIALRSFGDVEFGDLGGYIENESNLSHYGTCWISDDARVYGDAKVFEDAMVSDEAQVYENAKVYGNACVYENAKVYGKACVYGYAEIHEEAEVYDYANVRDTAEIYGNAKLYEHADIFSMADICDNAQVYGNACIFGSVYENAKVYGVCTIGCGSYIDRDADINGSNDYCEMTGLGLFDHTLAFFKLSTGSIGITGIRNIDTLEEFDCKIKEMEESDKLRKQYELIVDLVKIKFAI